jgi:glutamine synthetase-like protein
VDADAMSEGIGFDGLSIRGFQEIQESDMLVVPRPDHGSIIKRRMKISIDWSYLNWANISLSAILVFVAALIGNVLSFNNNLIAPTVATFLFATLYVCVRANFSELFSSMAGQKDAAKNQLMATHGLMGSWF